MLVNYKSIGDTLTTAELNAYACLLAHNKTLVDSIELKNGDILGLYGKYTFDLSNCTIVDNGVLITDETINNGLTVELTNPTQFATYTLHLKVLRYGEATLLDEETTDTITLDLTVDLVKDTAIAIPLSDLQEYDVILFDSNITIQHNKPEIKGEWVNEIIVSTSKNPLQTSETTEIYGKVLNNTGVGVQGETVKFYEVFIPSFIKTYASKNLLQTGETVEIKARLSDEDGSAIPNQTVYFYEEYDYTDLKIRITDNPIQTGETTEITARLSDEDGSSIKDELVAFSKDIDSTDWSISGDISSDTIEVGDEVDITATVTDDDDNAVSGIYVRFYEEIYEE